MVGLVIITDGRWDYLRRCLATINQLSHIDDAVIVNDSEQPFPDAPCPVLDGPRRGLAGAVRAGWEYATEQGWDYLFHLEEDFLLDITVDVTNLAELLKRCPSLAQICLKRQPWSWEENQAGGICELRPDDYREKFIHGTVLTEHSLVYSLNPHLTSRAIFSQGWPDGNEYEQTNRLVAQGYHFAYLGRKFAAPTCTHIGVNRSQGWRQ